MVETYVNLLLRYNADMSSASYSRQGRSLLLFLALISMLSGCDLGPFPIHPQPSPPVASPTPSQPPRPRGGTLTIRLLDDVPQLNPWLNAGNRDADNVSSILFGGLTRLDNRLQPQPDLAERWDVSEDGTSLIFHLRKDVFWHDARPFSAEDVVWSYRTMLGLKSSYHSFLRIQETVQAVEAVEPITWTVRLKLKSRNSPLLADLSMPVLPSHILSGTTADRLAQSQFNEAPIGTGAFTFASREPGKSITLKANENYYGGRPAIDRVACLVAPIEEVAENAVREGNLMLGQFSPSSAERLVADVGGARGGAYNELG